MTSNLARRIAFTLGVLLIYRLGSYIPLPGIDPQVWGRVFGSPPGQGLASMVLFGGGAHRVAIFALNLAPYVSAAIIVQLAATISFRLRALRSQGRRGRDITERITLGLTVLFAALQASGIALALKNVKGLVADPGPTFVVSSIVTLMGGTLLLVWLSRQITLRGIGNGIALMLLVSSTSALREPILAIRELSIRGIASQNAILGLSITVAVVTWLVVLIEQARRNFRVHFPRRDLGGRVFDNLTSYLPFKLNPAGIIPVLLASWILSILATILYLAGYLAPNLIEPSAVALIAGRPLYLIVNAVLIFGGTLFYAAYLFDPELLADRLREYGGTIDAIEPGQSTAGHFDYVLSRTTILGAAYLTLICLLPDMLLWYANVPVYFGGQLLLVLVCTTLDLEMQVRGSVARAQRS